jgi:hypothetical protein
VLAVDVAQIGDVERVFVARSAAGDIDGSNAAAQVVDDARFGLTVSVMELLDSAMVVDRGGLLRLLEVFNILRMTETVLIVVDQLGNRWCHNHARNKVLRQRAQADYSGSVFRRTFQAAFSGRRSGRDLRRQRNSLIAR